MKLVFVNRFFHPDISATSKLVSELAAELADCGFQVHAIASRLRYEGKGDRLAPAESWRGVKILRVRSTAFGRSRPAGRLFDCATFLAGARSALKRLVEPGDIVISMTDPPMLPTAILPIARRRRATQVNWLQDIFPEIAIQLAPNPLVKSLLTFLRPPRDRSLRGVHNVAISRASREWVERIAPGTTHLIPNWANGARVRPEPHETNALRHEWNPENRFVVAYFGNLGRVHDADTLLETATLLKDDPSILFLVAGGGARLPAVKQAQTERALPNLRFLPYQPEERLCASLGAADVHLISLLPGMETFVFPSKLYGILAAGRPCLFIGEPDSEIAEILQANRCGYPVRTGDSNSLANHIRLLQSNRKQTEAMGRHARDLFERDHNLHVALERWKHLLTYSISAS